MSPKRSLRKGAFVGADGLPRPLRGHEPRDGGLRKQQRRRYILGRMAIDVDSFPVGLRRKLLEHHGPLTAIERKRLCAALLTRDIDAGRIGLVFNLLGDKPVGDHDLVDLVERIRAEHERAARPSTNFTFVSARQREEPLSEYIAVCLRPDDGVGDVWLSLAGANLATLGAFRRACIAQARFAPTFRDGQYERFVETLLEVARKGTREHA